MAGSHLTRAPLRHAGPEAANQCWPESEEWGHDEKVLRFSGDPDGRLGRSGARRRSADQKGAPSGASRELLRQPLELAELQRGRLSDQLLRRDALWNARRGPRLRIERRRLQSVVQ